MKKFILFLMATLIASVIGVIVWNRQHPDRQSEDDQRTYL
ncbi:MAG: hypothetical protein ACI8QD_001362 [Cyclobacteriaceae bacterium]|jgi:hypothetical protein